MLFFVIVKTTVDASLHLGKNIRDSIAQLEYSRIIDSLMYIMSCTCLDIVYDVSKLSHYTSNSYQDQWKVVLEGYSDATRYRALKTPNSQVVTFLPLEVGVVSWKSSKQTCIVRSIMEYEFIALDKVGEEA